MALRFYSVAFVFITGVFGLVTSPDLPFVTAQPQTVQARKGEADRLLNLGIQQFNISQFVAAMQSWQQALTIYREIKDRRGEGAALGNLGLVYLNLGQYDKAIDSELQFLAISREIKDRRSEGAALGNLGLAYLNLGQYDKAIDSELQLLAIAKEIKDRQSEGKALGNLGLAYLNLGQYDKAIDSELRLLAIAKEIKDRQSEGKALGNLGLAYYALGQYDKAIDYHLQALAINRKIKDRRGEAQSLGNLGIAYYSLSKYDKAIDFHLQRLAIAREIKYLRGEEQSLGNLGVTYYALGQYDKAIDYHLQSLAIKRKIKDRRGESHTLGNLGVAYYALGQYDKAIDYHLQYLAISREIKNRRGEGNALGNLGVAYLNLGQDDKALDSELQYLAIAREIKNRGGEAEALKNLGETYSKLNRERDAMIAFQQALTIAREIGDRSIEGSALGNLGRVLSKIKQPELAILFYKQSVNVREAIRNEIRKLDKDLQKFYLNTIADDYRQLADLLLKQDRILEAQQVLDLLKVQELSDYLHTVRGNSETAKGTEYRPPEQSFIALAIELDDLQKRKLENKLTDAEQERLNQLVQSEREQTKQFTAFLNSPPVQKIVDELRRTEKQQNIDTENLRNLRTDILAQHPNAVLLYPLILEDRLELILVTAKTPPIHRTVQVKREELNDAIFEFRVELRDTNSEDVKKTAKQLHSWLIEPFASELEQLKIDTIIYAPDGQLRYIPLASLYDGKQWLIAKYRVNNITAASLTKFNKPPIAKPHIFAGAYGNVNKAGFDGLPATLSEVKKIVDRFPNTSTFVETAFTKNVTEINSNFYTVLHLATHGQLSHGKPEDSFILFGDGTKATISDVREWVLTNVDLVILSACQSGIGSQLGNGIEILGLGYQMQAAGARVAIASLWKVDDAGTQALMDAFYGELQKGDVPIAEALRRAQISLIESPNYNHPNFWSAFFAIGNGL